MQQFGHYWSLRDTCSTDNRTVITEAVIYNRAGDHVRGEYWSLKGTYSTNNRVVIYDRKTVFGKLSELATWQCSLMTH